MTNPTNQASGDPHALPGVYHGHAEDGKAYRIVAEDELVALKNAAALATQPAPAEPAEDALCPRCDGEGTIVVMSDGGPDAYEVTVDCPHCRGKQTLYAGYQGAVELLEQSEAKYQKAASILYLGRANPTASKRLTELAEYVVRPGMQADWLRARLIDLADMASVAASPVTQPAAPAEVVAPFAEIFAELARATTKFPTWPTDPLHALAVLGEEFGELTKDMLQMVYEPHKTSRENVRTEALQTAAMALRLFASLDAYEYTPGAQHSQNERSV